MKYMNKEDWAEIWDDKLFLLLDLILRPFFWKNYLKFFKKLKLSSKSSIIELGCGTGKNSLKMSKIYGSKISLIDNCNLILRRAKKNFEKNNVKANFILKNVFKINTKKRYDLVLSDGLIEHFTGSKRKKLFKIHKSLMKDGGYLLFFVPLSSSLYWFSRKFLEKLGLWKWDEVPLFKEEILEFCHENNLKPIKISNLFFGLWVGVLAQKF